jgi:membrane protein DedA with SNARE-associated domain
VYAGADFNMNVIVEFVLKHGYSILFAAAFAHQIGLPLPGPLFLLAAGALAAAGKLGFVASIGLAVTACVLADWAWYEAGRRRGDKVLHFIHRLTRDPDYHDRRAKETFARFGLPLLLLAKFVPGLDAIAPPLAGTSRTSRLRFLACDAVGAAIYSCAYAGLGYVFSHDLNRAAAYASRAGIVFAGVGLSALCIYAGRKLVQRYRRTRDFGPVWVTPVDPMGLDSTVAQVAVTSCTVKRIRVMTTTLVVAAVTALGLGLDSAADDRNAHVTLPSSPQQLVAVTIANELKHAAAGIHLAYTASERDANKNRTKRIVETPNGDVSLTIAEGGRPLSPEELRDEKLHVRKLLEDAAARAAHRKKQQRDDAEEQTLLRSIPDAFIFEYAGVRADVEGDIVTVHFSPNPQFHPPSRESQVFQGMRGVMEISLPAARIVRIEGNIFQPVNFGWGILGRLNPGGRFLIEQAQVSNGRWEVTHTVLRFTGKVLLVKDLNIDEESHNTDFQAIPPLSLTDAVDFAAQRQVIGQNSARGFR